jgi:hypothetical protein
MPQDSPGVIVIDDSTKHNNRSSQIDEGIAPDNTREIPIKQKFITITLAGSNVGHLLSTLPLVGVIIDMTGSECKATSSSHDCNHPNHDGVIRLDTMSMSNASSDAIQQRQQTTQSMNYNELLSWIRHQCDSIEDRKKSSIHQHNYDNSCTGRRATILSKEEKIQCACRVCFSSTLLVDHREVLGWIKKVKL